MKLPLHNNINLARVLYRNISYLPSHENIAVTAELRDVLFQRETGRHCMVGLIVVMIRVLHSHWSRSLQILSSHWSRSVQILSSHWSRSTQILSSHWSRSLQILSSHWWTHNIMTLLKPCAI